MCEVLRSIPTMVWNLRDCYESQFDIQPRAIGAAHNYGRLPVDSAFYSPRNALNTYQLMGKVMITRSVAAGSADTVCTFRPLMTQVQHWAKTAQIDNVTLRPWPLTLEVIAPDAGRRPPSVHQVWISKALPVRKIWRTMCVSINGPGDLDLWPFDIHNHHHHKRTD